jgi:hypothetical protein
MHEHDISIQAFVVSFSNNKFLVSHTHAKHVAILSAVARVGFVQSSYTVRETSPDSENTLEVLIGVFNPPAAEDLAFSIDLAYETRTGTAGEFMN